MSLPTSIQRKPVLAMLVLAAVFTLAPRSALADTQPPDVALALASAGVATAGQPVVVTVTATNRTDAAVATALTLKASGGLTLAGRVQTLGVSLAGHASRSVSLAVVPREVGIHTLEVACDAGATSRLTLVVDAGAPGTTGRVLTLGRYLAVSAVSRYAGPRGQRQIGFPVRGAPRTPEAPSPAPGLTLKGVLAYTDRHGQPQPARRVAVQLYAARGGRDDGRQLLAEATTGQDGSYTVATGAPLSADVHPELVFALSGPRWKIVHPDENAVYSFQPPAPAGVGAAGAIDLGTLTVPADHPADKAFMILETLDKALDVFESNHIDIAWWTPISVQWPADGDYFGWGDVHLTQGYAWDVTGHEFGHALFNYGSQAVGSGGSHKIDQCYSASLAWSEGWATYFSAVAQLGADDPDARFEFLVPRRAPIRIENVPDDVCKGQDNEWRVAAALWDIYDTHVDGNDKLAVSFPRMWQAMRDGGRMADLESYLTALDKVLTDAERPLLLPLLQQNTIR